MRTSFASWGTSKNEVVVAVAAGTSKLLQELRGLVGESVDLHILETALTNSIHSRSAAQAASGADRAVVLWRANASVDSETTFARLMQLGELRACLGQERVFVCSDGQVPGPLANLPRLDLDRPDQVLSALRETATDRRFGFHHALAATHSDVENARAIVRAYDSGRKSEVPVRFETPRSCRATYCEALDHVQRRFLTTSRVRSEFWNRRDPEILLANHEMMGRLAQRGSRARRLFILDQRRTDFVRRWEGDLLQMRKRGDEIGIVRLRQQFEDLRANLEALQAGGCVVRVAHDGEGLLDTIGPVPEDDCDFREFAVYDSHRVDVFQCSGDGRVLRVDCLTPAFVDFDLQLERATQRFESLWSGSEGTRALTSSIEEVLNHASARVVYDSSWLARYDHALPAADELLKLGELAGVKVELSRSGRWGHIRRFMDIGTCTARYPIELLEAMEEGGQVLGVDSDLDCVLFARRKVTERCHDKSSSIQIAHADFCTDELPLVGPFDLITCMLGTMHHFGRDLEHQGPFSDRLQLALVRLYEHLAPDGSLFFTLWTERARSSRDMLAIYTEAEMDDLSAKLPLREEMGQRLDQAGLEVIQAIPIEGRLDLYHCRAQARPAAPGPANHTEWPS